MLFCTNEILGITLKERNRLHYRVIVEICIENSSSSSIFPPYMFCILYGIVNGWSEWENMLLNIHCDCDCNNKENSNVGILYGGCIVSSDLTY